MPDKPIKPGVKKPAALNPRTRSKVDDTTSVGKTVRVGGEWSLKDLAEQAGLRLVRPLATIWRKKIRKASGGVVLIK